ncbi:hypothetical protein [Anditalea andensis]|uniref:Tetratricopeptide repeat protein n=1 Tax=Anditalea andensis TaxID=1048983 RepID=A0A074KWV9_9BACT|nr:hypothetical protein [Anditalea andensis]KEO72078.1 hypothetical protein EL17_19390 [Anditalea andensis]
MKNSILTFALFLSIIAASLAIDPAYEKAMLSQLEQLGQAKTQEEFQAAANAFARIGEMKQEAWLPQYYAALAYTRMSLQHPGNVIDKDALLAKAKEHLSKATDLSPSNSELVTLDGFIIMARLSADPQRRGQSLSPKVMQTYGKAIELDKSNPRPLMLMAQMEYGMAQYFGQGPEKACGLARISLDLYKQEGANASENNLNPTWGKEMAEQLTKRCK